MRTSRKKRILVTGGAGYIGSHACKALARAGYTPISYDNLSRGFRSAVRWGPFEHGDLNDSARLDAVVAEHRPDAVLHFAARAYVGESVSDPAGYYRNNVAGTLTLLETMTRYGIDRIVFSSTCATYGIPCSLPLSEDQPQHPINPYGASKLMIERMLQDFDTAYGLRSLSLRYFNAAGADPDGETGELHDPETHLVPLVLQVASGQRPSIEVFGDDYPTPDGSCIRDYVHVSDLADAHVLALNYLDDDGATTAVNLGTGTGHSVLEVVETARRVTGRAIPLKVCQRRPGDPPTLTASAERAHDWLAWTPRYPALDDIIRHAWSWHRKQVPGARA